MPFTVSHAAAVLPFRRTRLPWSALVIGSFGPDFEYFLRLESAYRAWHHYPDVLIYCLPFTIFAYFLFHELIKEPAVRLLPTGMQRRIRLGDRHPQSYVALIAALVLGIATHLAWDSVTHAYSWPWRHVALLRRLLYRSHLTGDVYGFELAQTLSSVGGLVILIFYFAAWYRRTPVTSAADEVFSPKLRWSILGAMLLIAAVAGAFYTASRLRPSDFDFAELLVISSMSWFMWEMVGYSVIARLWRRHG